MENSDNLIYEKDGVIVLFCYCSLGIYIMNITSKYSQQGIGTKVLKEFINDYKNNNIYLFSSGEFDVDTEILNKWYSKLGFVKTNINIADIPYKCSHVLINKNN